MSVLLEKKNFFLIHIKGIILNYVHIYFLPYFLFSELLFKNYTLFK